MSHRDASRAASLPRMAPAHEAGRVEGFVASVHAFLNAGEHSLAALESQLAEERPRTLRRWDSRQRYGEDIARQRRL